MNDNLAYRKILKCVSVKQIQILGNTYLKLDVNGGGQSLRGEQKIQTALYNTCHWLGWGGEFFPSGDFVLNDSTLCAHHGMISSAIIR